MDSTYCNYKIAVHSNGNKLAVLKKFIDQLDYLYFTYIF
jgi:hypothetical protein